MIREADVGWPDTAPNGGRTRLGEVDLADVGDRKDAAGRARGYSKRTRPGAMLGELRVGASSHAAGESLGASVLSAAPVLVLQDCD
jgi:hypothetical protein